MRASEESDPEVSSSNERVPDPEVAVKARTDARLPEPGLLAGTSLGRQRQCVQVDAIRPPSRSDCSGSPTWAAKWIEDPEYTYQTDGEPNPLPVFGTEFGIRGGIVSAWLCATGLGQYVATLNSKPVGDAVLEPGQTSYWKEVHYRTYDVTDLLERRDDVLGFEVGSGVRCLGRTRAG